jgi:hypothetical protein
MQDEPAGENRNRALNNDKIIERTKDIDFQAVRRRLDATEALVARHRVTQEKLDLEISI